MPTAITTALHHSHSGSREDGFSLHHDQDAADPQLQHGTTHELPGSTFAMDTALEEQVPSSATAAVDHDDIGLDVHASSVATGDASKGADASFLDQLFCCPITKVPDLLHLEGA